MWLRLDRPPTWSPGRVQLRAELGKFPRPGQELAWLLQGNACRDLAALFSLFCSSVGLASTWPPPLFPWPTARDPSARFSQALACLSNAVTSRCGRDARPAPISLWLGIPQTWALTPRPEAGRCSRGPSKPPTTSPPSPEHAPRPSPSCGSLICWGRAGACSPGCMAAVSDAGRLVCADRTR